MTKKLLLYSCIALLTGATAQAQSKKSPLTGAWKVVEVTRTGPNAGTNSNPQPGLYLFTGNHYSIITVNSNDPRPTVEDTAKASAAELNAVWGPFTANAGTYEINGSTLTTRPMVAKNPRLMAQGSSDTYTFKVEGKTLTLISVTNPQGKVANPTTSKLMRIE